MSGLSVVVPVAPGEAAWRTLLPDLAELGAEAEVLLVSPAPGEPVDGARWLEAPAGRARQQNAGARAARHETLWFLHADSRLPAGSLAALRRAIAARPEALHYFDLRFAADGPWATALNAWGARFRSRVLGLPFGDQGLCLARATFERLGGFDERAPYGEDHLLVWRAHRLGVPVLPVGAPLVTSARKYRERGWLATTLTHLRLTAAQAWPEWRASRR